MLATIPQVLAPLTIGYLVSYSSVLAASLTSSIIAFLAALWMGFVLEDPLKTSQKYEKLQMTTDMELEEPIDIGGGDETPLEEEEEDIEGREKDKDSQESDGGGFVAIIEKHTRGVGVGGGLGGTALEEMVDIEMAETVTSGRNDYINIINTKEE